MPRKPLINENLLQKITKAPPFQFRSKQNPQKPPLGFKSLKNIEISSPITKQLQTCIELINQQVQQKVTNNQIFLQRIAKLLLDIKIRWQMTEQQILQTGSEQYEITPPILRKSSSKYFNRNKMEFSDEPRLVQGIFFTDKSNTIGQLKKSILNKVKIGKENNQRFVISNEIKTEKNTKQLKQSEKIVNEQKGQIQRLKIQIQNLIETNQKLRYSKIATQQEIAALRNRMKCLQDEEMRLESDFQQKIIFEKLKAQQSINEGKVLRDRLQERQRQISALWQLQKI